VAQGELKRKINPEIFFDMEGDVLHVKRKDDSRRTRALHGLTRALVANMVEGVTSGFKKELIVTGVGYKVESKGSGLVLHLGYSHPIEFALPAGISAKVEKQKDIKIVLEGYDKEALGLARENQVLQAARASQGQGDQVCRRGHHQEGRQGGSEITDDFPGNQDDRKDTSQGEDPHEKENADPQEDIRDRGKAEALGVQEQPAHRCPAHR